MIFIVSIIMHKSLKLKQRVLFCNLIILKNGKSGGIPNVPGELLLLLKYLLKYLSWVRLGWAI